MSESTEVAIVGGGPSGSAAAVFTARYGLDTVVFDRGNAALRQSAYLANYPGFPGGIDIDTFYELLHAHLETAGATMVEEHVERVSRTTTEDGFEVETDEDRSVIADYVIAAAWYDGGYLRGLEAADAMFEMHEHHGESHERFDPDYPDQDGRTPIDGLYVAAPNGRRNAQAIVAAGQGAHVARTLLKDHRQRIGYPEGVAEEYDWLRPSSQFSGVWAERDRWREWFENEAGDHSLSAEQLEELRETYIDRAFDTERTEAEIETARKRGIRQLVEVIGPDRVLEVIDEDHLRSALEGRRDD